MFFEMVRRFPEAKLYRRRLFCGGCVFIFATWRFWKIFFGEESLKKPDVKWIIMELSGVNDIDAVAVDRLSDIMDNYREQGIQFVFAGMKGPVRDLVSKAGWREKYGKAM